MSPPECCAVNGSLNASSKAAQVTRAVNGSGYGAFGNPSQYLDGLSSQNPAAWFNLSNTFAAIDPPGWSRLLNELNTQPGHYLQQESLDIARPVQAFVHIVVRLCVHWRRLWQHSTKMAYWVQALEAARASSSDLVIIFLKG